MLLEQDVFRFLAKKKKNKMFLEVRTALIKRKGFGRTTFIICYKNRNPI